MTKPNFIIIFTDDQGYNDLSCFNSVLIKTPCIDKMASEGIRLTSFYDGAPLCGPSRASLMTGCYSQRVAERKGEKHIHTILDPSEILMPELLKGEGYATCAIGKWHLAGSSKEAVAVDTSGQGLEQYSMVDRSVMPCQKGFDRYFGIPYSNDMTPVVLMRDNEFIEFLGQSDKQAGITTRYTDEALDFIEEKQAQPFFLYLAHNMPHTPLYPHPDFEGKSEYGLYGDCVEEIDWNVGRILDRLKEVGIDDRTFVVFCSDNGPWINWQQEERNPDAKTSRFQSGRADPLRGMKMTTWEGGPRVPCVMRYPDRIPSGGVTDELVTAMDIFTTFAGLAGIQIPQDRIIDGIDVMPLLEGRNAEPPRECYYFYKFTHLHAVRSGDWKLVLPREAHPPDLEWYSCVQEEVKEITLYNLKADISETTNVAKQKPEVVKRLMTFVEQAREDLGDGSQGISGKGVRLGTIY